MYSLINKNINSIKPENQFKKYVSNELFNGFTIFNVK